jgi:phosphoserine phosphatase RsbU/P
MNAIASGLDINTTGAAEILDALADGAYITDTSRKILFWNRAAERITGWSAKDVVGHRCSENILVHVDKDGHQLCGEEHCPLHRAMMTGEQSREPLLVFAQHKEGRRIPVEVSVAPLPAGDGQILGGIEIFRDWSDALVDLRRAKVIQDNALHSPLPNDERVRFEIIYSPEELVGGDFYRVERIDSDVYAIMVADVMGHGVASALYTMQLRSLWEECRNLLNRPGEFLSAINRRLFKFTSAEGYFATAVFLTLNAESGRLRFASAAHPPPFVLRKDGSASKLTAKSPALGLFEDLDYSETEGNLSEGERLIFYTDGATELCNAEEKELGENGLLRILTECNNESDNLGEAERRLLQFTNRIRLPDDLTLLRIERC